MLANRFEQDVRPKDVGTQKLLGVENRAVDVRLGRKIDDRVDAGAKGGADRTRVADIAVDEAIAPVALDVAQVSGVPRIGHGVEIDDLEIGPLAQGKTDEIRPDEPQAAGN